MAVTVRKLFMDAGWRYGARLVAGEKGLDNLVDWIHILEDPKVAGFLRGQEVVLTAGILYQGEQWLFDLAKSLCEEEISAFVVNLGPHIREIPETVKEFCDREAMPLYVVPWKTHMVDMTRTFGQTLFEDRSKEQDIVSSVKNLIFGTGTQEEQVQVLERHGFRLNYPWTFVILSPASDERAAGTGDEDGLLLRIGTRLAEEMHPGMSAHFHYRDNLVFLLVNFTDEEIEKYVDAYQAELKRDHLLEDVQIGIGENIAGAAAQGENFERAFAVSCLARRRKKRVYYYKELDMERLLLEIHDTALLKKYYHDTIGRLLDYDQQNGTKWYEFLRVYLEKDGSPQAVSKELFIHRNTVGNYLKKVENILGLEKMGQKERVGLYLAYQVADLLL